MSELKWQDPPPKRSKTGAKWKLVVEELRQRPGVWALVIEGTPSHSPAPNLRGYGCEVTQRGPAGGPWDIYARWPRDKR